MQQTRIEFKFKVQLFASEKKTLFDLKVNLNEREMQSTFQLFWAVIVGKWLARQKARIAQAATVEAL
jgi:hypothetical protein